MPNPHPIIVHFPIALLIAAVVCEIAAYFLRSKLLHSASLVNGCAAAAGSAAAVITGLFAKPLVAGGPAVFVLESHETMGYLVMFSALAFAALKVYAWLSQSERFATATIGVGLIGLVFTIIAAHEGGELVYKHGIGVSKKPPVENRTYPYNKPVAEPSDADTAESGKTPQ